MVGLIFTTPGHDGDPSMTLARAMVIMTTASTGCPINGRRAKRSMMRPIITATTMASTMLAQTGR